VRQAPNGVLGTHTVYERALDDAFAARLRNPRALKRALADLTD